jgi:Uma2 family endonuclease
MEITSFSQLDPQLKYTYADYLLWQFQDRVELIKGYIRQMTAPSVRHQRISGRIYGSLWAFLKNKRCDVFAAPFDVRLPLPIHLQKGDKIDTVVQPDICIICDRSKLDDKGCIGAPELIVEILSPGNSRKEMRENMTFIKRPGCWSTGLCILLNRCSSGIFLMLPVSIRPNVLMYREIFQVLVFCLIFS